MARVTAHPILPGYGDERIGFTFEGAALDARPGETISSALFAHGIRTFGLHPADRSPQGLFCANGQCSQCMVLADGRPVKACMTAVREGLRVEKLAGLPAVPDLAWERVAFTDIEDLTCDLLIVGAGPAGLGAAIEAADAGLNVIVADDKDRLGGKLVLQTHMFFGSVAECFAGTRGIDIAGILAAETAKRQRIRVLTETLAVGVYADGKVGLVEGGHRYRLASPKSLLVATGARERALAFAGCDLPGVYGAGAFQTLLNRDLVMPSERLFIVGAGNVGLIAAYHALQAGIPVTGLIEGLPEVGGYWVHADKIRRFGVPIYTSHTVISANGTGAVESVTVAEVDAAWNVKPGSHRTYPCDTLLLAVGLERVNELYDAARRYDLDVYVAGDAEEIAEASAALFSGRVVGREIAKRQGRSVEVPESWRAMTALLKSKPGRDDLPLPERPAGADVFPLIWCNESIPCNPCGAVCPQGALDMPEGLLPRANFTGACRACGKCVAMCPGLAMTLVDMRQEAQGKAQVTLPYEFNVDFQEGDTLDLVGRRGDDICAGTVVRIADKLSRAPCSAACPADVHAQGYVELIRKRKFRDAADLLRADLPLPSVCGRVCYHPCEDACGRADVDDPVAIGALKRFVTDWALAHPGEIAPLPITHKERVAIIGSGPSGLACANALLRRGYAAKIFESREKAGGILRYGIPAYRLPRDILDKELDVLGRLGVDIETNRKAESLESLREQGFDAVYVAAGASEGAPLEVEGADCPCVTDAIAFLRQVNTGQIEKLSGTVAVIGGGNSALDAARAARRLGADDVRIVYRRSRAEMPAHDWEVSDAEAEGVRFDFLAAPLRVEESTGGAQLICQRMTLAEPDASGRRRPEAVEGSEFAMPVSLIVSAIGQRTALGGLSGAVELTRWNTVNADPLTQATNLPGVFAGGDVATGPSTVVDAFGAGKRAADSIDRYLRGRDLSEGCATKPPELRAGAIERVEKAPRARAAIRDAAARSNDFTEIAMTLSEDEAVREAERCLGCGAYCETLRAPHEQTGVTRERTSLVTVEVPAEHAMRIAGVRVQPKDVTEPIDTVMPPDDGDNVVVCRCERVTRGQIRRAVRAGVRDMNHLKAMLMAGMGACSGKTCGPLIRTIFRDESVPANEVTYFTQRPLDAEAPLGIFAAVREDGE